MIKRLLRYNIFIILIVCILGGIFYFWFDFKNKLVVIGGDNMVPLNPLANLKYLYKWLEIDNGLEGNLTNLPLFYFYALLQKIGLTITSSHFLYTYFIHVFGAMSLYYLSYVTFFNHPKRKIISFLSAVLYMFTPAIFNMNFTYGPYAFIPFILALFIDGLRRRKNYNTFPLLIALGFFAGCLPDPHPRPFIITFSLISLYAIFEVIQTKKIKKTILFFSLVVLFVFLVNAWFFIPYLHNILTPNYITSAVGKVPISYGVKFLDEGTATIDRMFRLFNDGLNMPTVRKDEYFANWISTITNYLYPLLAFGAVFFVFSRKRKREENSKIIFFLCVALIFLFAAKGPNPPMGNIYKWVLVNIPLFKIFRTTAYIILGSAVAYSILIPFTAVEISRFLKNKFIKIVSFLLFFIFIIVNSYPLFFGYSTLNAGNIVPADTTKHGIKIPDSYYELNKWLDENGFSGNKIIYLPLINGYEALKIGYFGIPIIPFILNKPLISSVTPSLFGSQKSTLQSTIYNQIIAGDFNSQILAGLSNIKYIIINNNVYGTEFNSINNKTKNTFAFIRNFEDLFLYQVDNKYILPHFYTPKDLIISDKNIDALSQIVPQPDYKIRSAIYFDEQDKNISKEALNKIEQYNLKKVIVLETKMDRIEKLDEEIKKINKTITNLEAKDFKKLSKKDKLLLKESNEEKQELEQERARLQMDSAQYFAEVEDANNYNFSFQLASCQEEKSLLLNTMPLITINNKSYNIPYEVVKAKENNKDVEKYKIKTDNDCFVNIKDIELEKGELKIAANYILGLNNLIFSKGYPKEVETPILEFKKVNPTKYVVKAHQVKDSFPLVFSENFHKGWKVYLAEPDNFQFSIFNFQSNSNNQIFNDQIKEKVKDYKILEGNEEDQASRGELEEFIKNGWVSTLGDLHEREIKHKRYEDGKEVLDHIEKYKIDFISKNFQGTIQNDNLPTGHIWDTWFKIPLPEESHLMANGYANSWIINVDEVCKNNKCVKNPDGSYDFEIVVEFWPQRLFYLGLIISGLTLFSCLGYLGYDWRRKRKIRTIQSNNKQNGKQDFN